MGGAFSCGEDNDDLVNILILLGYIKSKRVERVFRAVDRGDYVLPSHRDLAYKDLSIKLGNIHLSAPCVYCKVMEGLSLKPGLSFLNIGSGTGYLSTMAGLILGRNGTNHGIEMHEDCLIYAYENLEIFKEKSLDVDSFEFCEPVFKLGNILNASPNRQYDRVYCGAACPENHEQYIKQFVKIGGILVMPYKDNLLKAERVNENTWRNTTMLPVSFATLVTPPEDKERGNLQLPLWQPSTLQELCRSRIRCHLRKLVWSENEDLVYRAPLKAQPIERTIPTRPLGIPCFESRIRADRREEVPSTLRMVRAVLQLHEVSEDSGEAPQEAAAASGDNPGENACSAYPEISTAMEAEDSMDVEISGKEEKPSVATTSVDVEMEESERSNEKSMRNIRSQDSKLKRKSEAIGAHTEPHNSQRYRFSEENEVSGETSGLKASPSSSEAGVSNSDNEEPVEEDALGVAWIAQACSYLKDKIDAELEDETSDSGFDLPDSSSEESAFNEAIETANYRMEVLRNSQALPDSDEDEENPSDNEESRGKKSLSVRNEKLKCKQGNNSKKFVDFEAVAEENDDKKLEDPSGSQSESTSDEEKSAREEYRRTSRSGRKRRSEQRSTDDTSGSNESSNETYASESADSTDLDPDFNFNFIPERNLKQNAFAHTVRKEQISHFMQKKVSNLPLPQPLRLYLNYNREL